MYLLLREEREKICEFIIEQLRKEYIRLSKIALMFFVGKKNSRKYILVQRKYLLN